MTGVTCPPAELMMGLWRSVPNPCCETDKETDLDFNGSALGVTCTSLLLLLFLTVLKKFQKFLRVKSGQMLNFVFVLFRKVGGLNPFKKSLKKKTTILTCITSIGSN